MIVIVKVAQACLSLCDPVDYTVHGILQARILEWVTFPFSGRSSQPRDQTQVSNISGGFFTSWATREAQEYWSGYPTLLQGIFPTQELNQGLLHCRRILYQLSYQGSPWPCMCGSISGLSLLFCCLYVCLYANTILFWLSSFVIYFEVRKCGASSFVLSQNCFGYVRSFLVPCEF